MIQPERTGLTAFLSLALALLAQGADDGIVQGNWSLAPPRLGLHVQEPAIYALELLADSGVRVLPLQLDLAPCESQELAQTSAACASPWTAIAAVSAGNCSSGDGGYRYHPRATLVIVLACRLYHHVVWAAWAAQANLGLRSGPRPAHLRALSQSRR